MSLRRTANISRKPANIANIATMGMPGSETALEELMCRVLGHLLQEGIVVKIADDLYYVGNTSYELLENWKKVLQALYQCDLRLSASKTVVNPTSTTILRWRSGTWSGGLEPSGQPTSHCNPSLLSSTRDSSPHKIVYWCPQGPR